MYIIQLCKHTHNTHIHIYVYLHLTHTQTRTRMHTLKRIQTHMQHLHFRHILFCVHVDNKLAQVFEQLSTIMS